MKNSKVCKSVFGLKLAALGLFFCAVMWVSIYAVVMLPEQLSEIDAQGAGAVIAVFGAGIATAVVIVIILLAMAAAVILLIAALIVTLKENKYSPLRESAEGERKKYIAFRVVGDIICALTAAFLLYLSVSFGENGLPSLLTACLGLASLLAAEILPCVFKDEKGSDIIKE